jgi:uncharacterized Rmd1/YagE family protein
MSSRRDSSRSSTSRRNNNNNNNSNYQTISSVIPEHEPLLQRSLSDGTIQQQQQTTTTTNPSSPYPPLSSEHLQSIEDVAAALREKLPGRSRKAKGQFRRLLRPKDDWRGRLSVYTEGSSYDLIKLAERLKVERDSTSPHHRPFATTTTSTSGVTTPTIPKQRVPGTLFDPSWSVKVHFDVLHLSYGKKAIRTLMEETEDSAPEGDGLEIHGSSMMGSGGLFGGSTNMGGGSNMMASGSGDHSADYTFEISSFRDIFLFAFGSVVFWGFTSEKEERKFLYELTQFIDGQLFVDGASQNATEEMEFVFGVASRVSQDVVELATFSSGEKLAASCAIAQSSLLSIHEFRAQQTIARNEHIPSQIAETGQVTLTTEEITKEIGKLFVERHLVNLEPELLETPEVLWNDDTYAETYRLVFAYLEIRSRIDLLNRRFAIVGQLLDVLRTQQEQGHANRLEVIIIVLVAAEVIIQLVWNILLKDVLGWVGQKDHDGF